MKYVVRVHGTEMEVVVGPDGVRIGGETLVAHLTDIEGSPSSLLMIGDAVHRVFAQPGARRGDYALWVDGVRFDLEALDDRTKAIRELSAANQSIKGAAPLVAPMPGMIVRVNVNAGDAIQAGQGLIVMEAMKMENELRASAAGSVKRVLVEPGIAVEKGTLLLEME